MHPLWQIKQIVTIDGMWHIEMHGVGEPIIPTHLVGVIIWIAINVWGLADLLHYMDDTFGYEYDHVLVFYEPYGIYLPLKQAALLPLWDDVGLPHEQEKQVFSPTIEIIGFWVDPRDMSITMSASLKYDLIMVVRGFIDMTNSRTHPLVKWQQILGWMNWGLNAFPLLCPTLQSSYENISGKSQSHTPIFLNKRIICDLTWLSDLMQDLDGICMLNSVVWDQAHADLVIFCDACPQGLGFYCPLLNIGFCSQISDTSHLGTVFFLEALCIASALAWVTSVLSIGPHCLLIYMDLMDTVKLFHMMWGKSKEYNAIVFFAVEILLKSKKSLQVFHFLGVHNTVADVLSRMMVHIALTLHPHLDVRSFQPP